jgi:hypothetical protein
MFYNCPTDDSYDYPTGEFHEDISNNTLLFDNINLLEIHLGLLNTDENSGPVEIYFKLINILPKLLTINDVSIGLINKYNKTNGSEKNLLLVIILVHIYIGLTRKNTERVSDYEDIKLKIKESWEKYINSLIELS